MRNEEECFSSFQAARRYALRRLKYFFFFTFPVETTTHGLKQKLIRVNCKEESRLPKELLAGTRPIHARAPPGAPSPVKLRHETLSQNVPNLSIENATKMSKDRSYGVAIGPHCVANLYKGELQ